MKEIKALIFDLGKVVFDLSFDRVFQSWAASSGGDIEHVRNRFLFDGIFEKFERAEVSPAAFRTAVSKRLDLALTDDAFDKGWCDLYLDIYPGVESLLASLKAHYRLVALTNTNAIHYQMWPGKYAGVLGYFEKIFSSHELGCRKPEREAYETVLRYLNCKPAEVVFLDDNPDNIMGARLLQIPTIFVQSVAQVKEALLMLRAGGA